MNHPVVVLIGFSTAGKSHYLKIIEEHANHKIHCLDSDKYVAAEHDNHIYNVFMYLGREKAISYIENKEKEFIEFLIKENSAPLLVAAGPFLVIRDNWHKLVEARKPLIIHLEKKPESVYKSLLDRKKEQKSKLDTSHPNYGSWDKDVTTELIDGVYIDLNEESSLKNIHTLISNVTPIYKKYRNYVFDSDILKENKEEADALINLIFSVLSK